MNWASLAYLLSAGVFALIGLVCIDWFANRYPDHIPYDDETRKEEND